MKLKINILLILLILLFPIRNFSNDNLEYSLKQKALNYINLTYKINESDLEFRLLNNDLPQYKLFELNITDIQPAKDSILFTFKVNDFLNKKEYEAVQLKVTGQDFTPVRSNYSSVKNVNDTIRICYKDRNITIYDRATVKKMETADIITVKTSFGHVLKCRIISDDLAEVIK